MPKIKYSAEMKIRLVQEYLSGNGSYKSISKVNGIGRTSIKEWVRRFREHGEAAFLTYGKNKSYSKEFKLMCVEAVLSGSSTVDDIIARYDISSRHVLRDWISKYNANIELKDYDPKREVYMAGTRRKTTFDERKEIVEYCLSHDRDYKGTASIYYVSYSQVYYWVKRYESYGESGLIDKRGRHKTDEEKDELDRLRRENQRLKRQLEERNRMVELLKKVKELERM